MAGTDKPYHQMSAAERLTVRIARNRLLEQRSESALTVQNIVSHLQGARKRASYDAVAGLVGKIAIAVMSGQPKTHANSWVVAGSGPKRGRPTGYTDRQIDPECLSQILAGDDDIIDDPEALKIWLVCKFEGYQALSDNKT